MNIGKMIYLFAQGFFLGFGPCLMTCAPILLPYAATRKNWREGLFSALSFSLARVAVYVVLGALFGYFGAYILNFYYHSAAGYYVKTVMAGVVVIIGSAVIAGKDTNVRFCGAGQGNMFLLGLLAGLSPCLPLIGILTEVALISDNFFTGALYSLSFGAGTVLSPILLIGAFAPVVGRALTERFARTFSVICGVLLVGIGFYILIR